MNMDLSSKDWAGVTNEEIPRHEECSSWPETCVNLTLTRLQPLKQKLRTSHPSLSSCSTWKCCLKLLLIAGKRQRFGRTRPSAGFVVSHPSLPHPGQSRRQQLHGTVDLESFPESLDSYTDFSRQERIQDLLQQELLSEQPSCPSLPSVCWLQAEQLQLGNKASGAECFSKDSVPAELAFPGAQS